MKWRWHFTITLVALLILMIFTQGITFSSIWIPLFVGSGLPDMDHRFDKSMHRNILFHSLAIPIFPLIFEQSLLLVLLNFSVGLHCLCDTKFIRRKQVGFYCIKVIKIHRVYGMKGRASTLWLVLQFIGGSAILGVWLLLM